VLRAAERDAIRQLATDIPALWNATTTTDADRKEILRQVVERVEVAVQGTSEQVRVRITWAGGGQTEGKLVRPIARYTDRSDYARLCARVHELTTAGWSLEAIAHQLGTDDYPPLRRGHGWSAPSVQTLRSQLGLSHTHRHGSSRAALGPDEWWAREVAEQLAMPPSSLVNWIERGLVQAHQEQGGLHRWIVWADAAELERLRAYRHRAIGAQPRRRWTAASTGNDSRKGATS
jgi:hypothetical protein